MTLANLMYRCKSKLHCLQKHTNETPLHKTVQKTKNKPFCNVYNVNKSYLDEETFLCLKSLIVNVVASRPWSLVLEESPLHKASSTERNSSAVSTRSRSRILISKWWNGRNISERFSAGPSTFSAPSGK